MSEAKEDGFMGKLTHRQREVAMLLSHGKLRKEIAEILGISQNTVKTYAQIIFRKAGVNSQKKLMALYFAEHNI